MISLRRLARPLVRFSYRSGWFPWIQSRNELPFILTALGLTGQGAEIGVRHGEYSRFLLENWRGSVLHSVDPWRASSNDVDGEGKPLPQEELDEGHRLAVEALRPFGARSNIMRSTSAAAARELADGQLDFCYIDALHHYDAIRHDIEAWAPKVRRGGILAGHDYLDGWWGGSVYGVKTAVDDFAARRGLKLLTSREAVTPSWFLFLPR